MLENKYEILFNLRYNFIYYITAFITLIFVVEFYLKNRTYTKIQYYFLAILLLVITFFFGTRGEYVGTDTVNNIKYFTGRVVISDLSSLNDIGLFSLSMFLAKFSDNINFFLTAAAFIYLAPILLAIHNLQLRNPLIFFFCLLSMFYFKGMGINIQKQGIAFSFFICGISYLFNNKKIIGYSLFAVAFIFHASIIIPITVFFLSFEVKKINWVFVVYIITTLLSLINFNLNSILSNIPIVNILTESRLDTYYIDKGNYKIGFRPEFWLFNTIFTMIGYITLKNIDKFNSVFLSKNYKVFFVAYVLLSSFFFLMFSARFSDRFGLMSWVFIPLLLLPYTQIRYNLKYLNTLTIFLISVFLFIAFKFI
ncbi:EpsG family protein [Empedobacter stercoris]|uniref:EpsG family protein n=1 Tax=Empedobacter stercoris TaxID=1628248 RepID=UPI001CE041C3|nr:EpsG family protein [Empedobacter stercoris]MCA4782186.1 EpsG family protein [Empedobacter stercoris]